METMVDRTSPDFDDLARSLENDLRDPKNASDPELENIFQMLAIPEQRRDDVAVSAMSPTKLDLSPTIDADETEKENTLPGTMEEGTKPPPLLPADLPDDPKGFVPSFSFSTDSPKEEAEASFQSQLLGSPGMSKTSSLLKNGRPASPLLNETMAMHFPNIY